MEEETELKLSATPRTLARLAADPRLGRRRGAVQSLVAVYFDTPRRTLWRRGIVLRVRREQGRWVQTLKGRGTLEAGLHRRIESSQPVSSPVPRLGRIADAALRKRVARIARGKPLLPVFRVEVEREIRLVSPLPGASIEVSIDRGTIMAGAKRAPVSEIELELKRGPVWHLFELALALSQRYAARVAHRSKAERGFELAGAIRPAPVRARIDVVRRGMTANAAFKAVCVACLNHLQANHEGVVDGEDPEYLHQARVALRRLQSGLGAFKRLAAEEPFEQHARAVRRFTRALGPARDWDVFAEQTLSPVLEQFPGHAGLASIARACARLREDASSAPRRLFASRRYQRIALGMGEWLARPEALAGEAGEEDVRKHAALVLNRFHRRTLKRGKKIESSNARRLHKLRIATKKLRYAAGFFSPLFPGARAAPMLKALNDLQDLLGAMNDHATAPALIETATRTARGPLREQARKIIEHWNSAMLEERRRELSAAWKVFERAKRFWH
ncbi:MAG TPA: CHAD domain-containing protein [Burkholderiales bacterium]|nr:CHAD domain-containing protein [Burkholderiales bacterium]